MGDLAQTSSRKARSEEWKRGKGGGEKRKEDRSQLGNSSNRLRLGEFASSLYLGFSDSYQSLTQHPNIPRLFVR